MISGHIAIQFFWTVVFSMWIAYLSVVITLGISLYEAFSAFLKNLFAASLSRFSDTKKSIVFPFESTALYKYAFLPLIFSRVRDWA